MAKRDSMSTAHRSRNRSPKSAPDIGGTVVAPNDADDSAKPPRRGRRTHLTQIISTERVHLMRVEAVLACVAFALLYEEWLDGPNRPCFADAIAVARELVDEAIERLGSVHIS
jgi:hypothetical protein